MENDIKSIFDGWVAQFRCGDGGTWTSDGLPGTVGSTHHCAVTWWNHEVDHTEEAYRSVYRVIDYIAAHYPNNERGFGNLIYANNVLGWTPEQFKELDRKLQVEATVKPLLESVSEVGTETVR